MPLYGETIGGAGGRLISSSLRYSTTTCWIFMSVCSMSQSLLQKMACKCWATNIAEVIFPVDVRSLTCIMSTVTFDFAMPPRPSHGPFPWPGQPNSTHTILSHFAYSAGLSDQKLRFSFDLDAAVLRSTLFDCEARPFPSLTPGRPYSLPERVTVSSWVSYPTSAPQLRWGRQLPHQQDVLWTHRQHFFQ